MAHRETDDHLQGYEPFDERIRPVVLFTIWLVAGTLGVLAMMKLAHEGLEGEVREGSRAIHPLAAEREEPPEPRLQANPSLDLGLVRAREEERLSTYGWIDRQAGVVHLPIERAMELVAKEGLPARKEIGR